MELFFKTLFTGIIEGTVAAWYDLRWYICAMAAVLVVYLLYWKVKEFFQK